MKKVAVVGMGQGGMVAAIYLQRAGFSVTVFEKAKRGEVSYRWHDDIRSDIFSLTGLDMPSEGIYRQKSKWLFVSPNEKFTLPVPPAKPMEEISISRRGLSDYFANAFESEGGKIEFETQIDDLYLKNERVAGVISNGKAFEADLVIDASGLGSTLRGKLPKRFNVQSEPPKSGVLCGYRAFFRPVEGAKTVEEGIDSTLILKHLGEEGISWCNLTNEGVDVLVGRIGELTDENVKTALEDLRKFNPILSEELIYEERVNICLRATISNIVADGYILLGDSAYMTMPLMGSGIESSMKAGKEFADFAISGQAGDFEASKMWGFFRKYMAEFGADFAFIDALKRWALKRKPQVIDWVFGGGLIEKSDLALVSTDSGSAPKIPTKSILKKIGILFVHPSFTCSVIGALYRALKAKSVAKKCPKNYDMKRIEKWQKKYEARLEKC